MSMVNRFICLSVPLFLMMVIFSAGSSRAAQPSLFQARQLTTSDGTLAYRLFVAKNYQAAKKYPLLVFLHGSGERGTDDTIQVVKNFPEVFISDSMQARHPCFIVAPQCPLIGISTSWSGANIKIVMSILDSLKKE